MMKMPAPPPHTDRLWTCRRCAAISYLIWLPFMRAALLVALLASGLAFAPGPARGEDLDITDWQAVLTKAQGQTVYFNAWGGDPQINAYIDWAADRVAQDYNIALTHVKTADIADVVAQILVEKTTGQTRPGSVDLLWINGENFAAMKESGLLQQESWATQLPNWRLVDVAGKPTVVTDFTVLTDGLESPWGMAQLVFIHDKAITPHPPKSAEALLRWAAANQGRFTYPAPPDFTGSTFLKQLLLDLSPDPEPLSRPVTRAALADAKARLFDYLDQLHPHLWRQGAVFPSSGTALLTLMADSETDIAFAFNPAAASNAIARGDLPQTARSYIFENGTIGNTHFVAIPYNSGAKAAALVVANFLLSPQAQLRKQDPAMWGDPTVLDLSKLSQEEEALFRGLDLGIATLSPQELRPTLPEPHPSWMRSLEAAWYERYGVR